MESPPAQNSASHILNALNNDCIQECFRRLTNLRDLLSAAEVCKDFRENAKQCYPSVYKKIIIHDWFYLAYQNGLPSDRVKKFLIIFGHLIESIEWTSIDSVYVDKQTCISRDQKNDQEILNLISDFCGKTLKKLEIQNHVSNFNTRSPFKILKELTLNNSPPLNFELHLQLTCLKLVRHYTIVGNWLMRQFPNLEKLAFIAMNDLTDDMIVHISTLNPQLRCLNVTRCDQITTAIFKNISHRLPNLMKLNITASNLSIDRNMMDLSELQHLKYLTLQCQCNSIGDLIDAFADNNIPIEELILDELTRDISDTLAKLKKLRKLEISGIDDSMLINLTKKLSALEKLDVYAEELTIHGIRKALEYGIHLNDLSICIDNTINPITINLNMFNSILKLVKGRVNVRMKIYIATIDVPENVQNLNRKWINIQSSNGLMYRHHK